MVVAGVVVGHPEDVVVAAAVVEQHFQPTLEMLVKAVAEIVAVMTVAQVTVAQEIVAELAAVVVVEAVFLGLEAVAGS